MELEVNSKGYIDNRGQPVKESIFARFKKPIAAAAASMMMASGIGAMAEETTPTVDNPTKIESEVASEVLGKDEMPQLPEDNSNESEVNTTEGEITTKGVGDLLANADNGVVTSGDVGVEVPNNNGGEVQYASNVVNNNEKSAVKTLEGVGTTETERTLEEITIKNAVNYLNAAPATTEGDIGYTDEDIKNKLIILNDENTDGLGLAHTQNIQGIYLGYLENQINNNFFLIIGTQNKKKDRFVTALKIPLIPLCDPACPLKFNITQLKGRNWFAGSVSTSSTKNKEVLSSFLSSMIGSDFILDLYTDKVETADINNVRSYGDSTVNYVTDLQTNYLFSRSLTYELYRSAIGKSKFKDPGLTTWQIKNGADINQVTSSILALNTIDVSTIPVTLGVHFF
ncbi:MAG: hypothetical protein KIH89_000050 [Candidatus Shapirobacteria bacterium]|nr:hypothetical protein [Candidatus Shapirobacteria bacterium]